jgi:hypothetical protein
MNADNIAAALTKQLKSTDVQICNWGRRYVVRKGCTVVARGNAVYVNGKGAAFLVGSFKAYVA